MFKVTKRLKDANIAHRLMNYNGPCENIHGHTYHFEIDISSNKLDQLGMVIDFSTLKKICDNWIQANWDHSILVADQDTELKNLVFNLTSGNKYFIMPSNTTAEYMASYLFSMFSKEFRKFENIKLTEVRVWETETSIASYQGE